MKILISNDDGVNAPGIKALHQALEGMAEVAVCAPDRDHSGASNSLTLTRPLMATEIQDRWFSVDGTPADSVYLGMNGIAGIEPDCVFSGINSGANLGDDVLYSGTVAAALEGRSLSLPAVAISYVDRNLHHLDTAKRVAQMLAERLSDIPMPPYTVLNVNVPDLPWNQLSGVKVTRLGHRQRAAKPEKIIDPRGKTRYWVSAVGSVADDSDGTDFDAIKKGFVSITPVHFDMCEHSVREELSQWLDKNKF
ncbi:5'/3'-nucleotidase SurE [Litoribrevibacter albus]|uniref:5'-nucleotidase SurE n=1 Tax=Litoribrevibacter albus TaxID=1473156 RepID=A0AA37W7A6_9GAMM|nr:5'/3'-nucleotidase SurE [Litoribrevibacter albus]GLQ31154.1 5'-nucleotidase SurE [Litoribrevibacter albus]